MLCFAADFLREEVAPCFVAMAQSARRHTFENLLSWAQTFDDDEDYHASILESCGESVEQFSAGILGNSWGGLQELSLCLRSNNVLVVCIRTLELDKTSRAEKCCKIVNFFPPERPVYVICAVSVEDKHWDLGVVSSPDHGWNALFPIDSWHESCQKIIDFLLHDKKQKFAWKPPATNGLPSPLTALFLPLPPPTFFFH